MLTLRAIAARGGALALVAACAAIAVGGTVLASGVSQGQARTGALAPLLLLSGVLVTVPAIELARRRRTEVSLVRVRGGHGARLVGAVLGEIVGAVLAGAVGGLVLAALELTHLELTWYGDLLDAGELVAAGVATLVVAVPAAGCAVVVAREPLAVALRRPTWTGPSPRIAFVGLVLGIGALLAALPAVYRAGDDDPGLLVLAGPALVGLAAGQVVVWLHRALGRRAGLAGHRSLGLLLGVRRALAPDHAPTLRALIAAGTVVAAAACAVSATDAWADDSARVGNGGPIRVDLPASSALQGLLLTEDLDPDGRWLMAAAVSDERDETARRIAWLDLARYDRVLGDHLTDTPADVSAAIGKLLDAEPVRLVTGAELRVSANPPATVTVEYLDDDGVVTSVPVEVDASATGTAPVDDCTRSCVFLELESPVHTAVTRVTLGDEVLVDEQLELTAEVPEQPAVTDAPEPMLVAGTLEPGIVQVDGIGGTPRRLEVVGKRDALPLLSGAGLLGDLRVGLAAATGSIPAVDSVILARADTPRSVLDGLEAAGADSPSHWDPDGQLAPRELAERRVARVTTFAVGALGLLVLLAGAGRRAAATLQERRSLRLVGVGRRPLRIAGIVEATLLGLVVAGATAVAGWIATARVVDGSDVVVPGATDLPFGTALSTPLVVGVAVATGLAFVAVLLLLRRLGARR